MAGRWFLPHDGGHSRRSQRVGAPSALGQSQAAVVAFDESRLSSAYAAFYPAVAFAAYTGARRGEVLALRWSELDFDAGTVTISRSLAQTRDGLFFKEPKSGRTRTLSISSTLVAILCSHRVAQGAEKLALGAAYQDEGLVFARPDGSSLTPWNFGAAFAISCAVQAFLGFVFTISGTLTPRCSRRPGFQSRSCPSVLVTQPSLSPWTATWSSTVTATKPRRRRSRDSWRASVRGL